MAEGKASSNLAFLGLLLLLLSRPSESASVLNAGNGLGPGQALTWGPYSFTMQFDCNLVLYDRSRAVWATGTNNRGSSCTLRMQYDGNLVIYDVAGNVVWASGTNRARANYFLELQPDRNVVIYAPGRRAIWATGTVAK